MKNIDNRSRRRRRIVAGFVLGTAVLASYAGITAVRKVFDRPGEAALRYVPSDAMMVVSFDLVPSASQALAFKRIDDSLARNGQEKVLESSLSDVILQGPAAAALRPLVLRSGAFALEPNGDRPNDASPLVFLALSDGSKASDVLKQNTEKLFYKGLPYYKTKNSGMVLMVVDDLLVMSDKPAGFMKVKAIQDGTAKSITTTSEFSAARQSIASDANVVVYLSPRLATSFVPKNQQDVAMPDWAAVGLAIRDGGIGVSSSSKMDPAKLAGLQNLTGIKPVRSDLFDVLPTGSYGIFAISQPANYFDWVKTSYAGNKDFAKGLAEGVDAVQKATGLSVKLDIVPALKGDVVAALYPSQESPAAGADLLLVVDDTNGADPGTTVERLRDYFEAQVAKEGNSPKIFNEKDINGGREFRIAEKTEQDFRKGMGEGKPNDVVRQDIMSAHKTVVYAIVGKTVLAASSQDLLDRAVASYESKTNGLSGDAKFAPTEKDLLDGSQSFAVFSLSRIAEGVRGTLVPPKDANAAKLMSSVLAAFQSLNDPLYIKGKTSPDGLSTAGVFIPLDYDKIIDIIAGELNKNKK